MSNLRISVGRFWHESNSFSSIRTEVADFVSYQDGLLTGATILHRPERRDEVLGAAEVLARDSRVEIVPLLSAGALPSGLLSDDALAFLEGALREQLEQAGQLDGICFALHGAMSGVSIGDLDGHMLGIMRESVGPDVPIVIALDCHAVVTRQMVELADALIAYRTHPHVDLVETGARAAQILLDTLDRKIKPVTGFQKIPLILPPPDDGTRAGALKELFDSFIAWDQMENVIAGSLCPSFAWQDVPEQGVTALAVTNNDAELADRLAGELAQRVWDTRVQQGPEGMCTPFEALQRAAKIDGCPVVITDSADTVGGGAPGDNTAILQAVLEHRQLIDGLILAHLPAARAVASLAGAKVGDTVTLEVGGERDTSFCEPLSVSGEVLCITEGPIADDAGAGSDSTIQTGTIVCLGIDNVRLVLSERVILGPQPSLFRKVGIEPFDARVVTLKTGIGFKMTYGHVAKAVIRADCPGAQSYNLSNYAYKQVQRPMYPLDDDFQWQARPQSTGPSRRPPPHP